MCGAPRWPSRTLTGPSSPAPWPHELPTVTEVRDCARAFKARTALGADWLRPRDLYLLSDAALELYIQIFGLALAMNEIPAVWALLLVALLPKPDGGDRPIGLFPTFLRVLSRWYRRRLGQRWLAITDSPVHFGTSGRSTPWCVWLQSLAA